MMQFLKWLLRIGVFALLGACTLTGEDITPEPLVTPTPIITGAPTVAITSPQNGAEVNVGDDVLVSAVATDEGGITQVQLFADGRLVKTQPAPAEDNLNVSVVLEYEARTAGEVELEVVAYRGTVSSDPDSVTIEVLEEEEVVTTPIQTGGGNVPVINPNDPTCRIFPNVNLNYRTGPGVNYNRLGTFAAGQQVPIVGRLGDNSWWQVQVNSFTRAWVSSAYTTEYGICTGVPIVLPPPSPTSNVPTATPPPTHTPIPTETPVPTNTPIPNPPDLVISDIAGPSQLTSGTSGTYTVQITNTGGSPSGEFGNTVRYLPGGSTMELGVVSNLNAGESIVLQIELDFGGDGEYTIQATADVPDGVDEISEVNNTGNYVVTVDQDGMDIIGEQSGE